MRTVQRIEKEGTCSLDSGQALAAVFELSAETIQIDPIRIAGDLNSRKGHKLGMLGNTIGFICAYLGITYSLVSGNLSWFEAGAWYGGIAFFCGITYVGITLLSEYFRKNRIGYE